MATKINSERKVLKESIKIRDMKNANKRALDAVNELYELTNDPIYLEMANLLIQKIMI